MISRAAQLAAESIWMPVDMARSDGLDVRSRCGVAASESFGAALYADGNDRTFFFWLNQTLHELECSEDTA